MAQKLVQLRYYGYNVNSNSGHINVPSVSTLDEALVQWNDGGAFSGYFPILYLGIQTLPGIEFSINGSDSTVIVGNNGRFEMDFSKGGEVLSLSFTKKSLERIASEVEAFLLVDIIYEP